MGRRVNEPLASLQWGLTRWQGMARILVGEDNALLLEAIRDRLELDGYRVCVITNGVQALEAFSHFRPELIVTDVAMPEMNGLELCRRVRCESPGMVIPFVFISARSARDEAVEQIAKTNSTYCLTKPFGPEELLEAVHKFLGRRESTLALPADLSPAGTSAAEKGDMLN
jgi:CheY-like chemotaxis protein